MVAELTKSSEVESEYGEIVRDQKEGQWTALVSDTISRKVKGVCLSDEVE